MTIQEGTREASDSEEAVEAEGWHKSKSNDNAPLVESKKPMLTSTPDCFVLYTIPNPETEKEKGKAQTDPSFDGDVHLKWVTLVSFPLSQLWMNLMDY